jgi:hypothetical protein
MVDLQFTIDDVPFSKVPMILGNDFAQILLVILHGSWAEIVQACLQ